MNKPKIHFQHGIIKIKNQILTHSINNIVSCYTLHNEI